MEPECITWIPGTVARQTEKALQSCKQKVHSGPGEAEKNPGSFGGYCSPQETLSSPVEDEHDAHLPTAKFFSPPGTDQKSAWVKLYTIEDLLTETEENKTQPQNWTGFWASTLVTSDSSLPHFPL